MDEAYWKRDMNEKKTVLVVDDEYKINEAVAAYLKTKGFSVFSAETGADALRIFGENEVDFVILDLMLPDISGEEICSAIRKTSSVPVIMLTAKSREEDILRGLNIGADDYVLKPFSVKQLYARMEAILRRTVEIPRVLSFDGGALQIDFCTMELKKNGREVYLTSSEWKLLSALVNHPNAVFSREKLIELVFGYDFDGYDRAIDTHVKNIRKKIEDDTKTPRYILTVHGSGYKFGGRP